MNKTTTRESKISECVETALRLGRSLGASRKPAARTLNSLMKLRTSVSEVDAVIEHVLTGGISPQEILASRYLFLNKVVEYSQEPSLHAVNARQRAKSATQAANHLHQAALLLNSIKNPHIAALLENLAMDVEAFAAKDLLFPDQIVEGQQLSLVAVSTGSSAEFASRGGTSKPRPQIIRSLSSLLSGDIPGRDSVIARLVTFVANEKTSPQDVAQALRQNKRG